MREASATAWLDALSPWDRIHVYTVDPGAHAIALELVPLLKRAHRIGAWFARGWSGARGERTVAPAEMAAILKPGELLLVGSQTDFADTQAAFGAARRAGADSGFMFDHWKNYREHFDPQDLPVLMIVPDEQGRRLLLEAVGESARNTVRVLPHLALEASTERILEFEQREPGMIALLLDPTEPEHGLGYDWRSTLRSAAAEYVRGPWRHLRVRPHPRQRRDDVAAAIAALHSLGKPVSLCTSDTEALIAMADEVWGMTTVALVAARLAGKPIRSFQVGRNAIGAAASNPHIEPFAIV